MKLRLFLACGAAFLTMSGAPEARAQGFYGPSFFSGYGVSPNSACGSAPPVFAAPTCGYAPPVWSAPAPYSYAYAQPAPYGYGPPVSGRAIIPPGVRVVDAPYGAPAWDAPFYGLAYGGPQAYQAPSFSYGPGPSYGYSGVPDHGPKGDWGFGAYPPEFGGIELSARSPHDLPRCDYLNPASHPMPTYCALPQGRGGPAVAYWDGWRVVRISGG